MLTIYRRHGPKCGKTSRRYRRCSCPIWIEGSSGGRKVKRHSLGTRSWAEAERIKRNRETGIAEVTIDQAATDFLIDAERRSLSESTLYRYNGFTAKLKAFADKKGIIKLSDLNVPDVREFSAALHVKPTTQCLYISMLRLFFRFCQDNKWVEENPARAIRPPQLRLRPTLPFTQDQMTAILAASPATRDRAFLLVMRYSGLRIGDVTTLAKERIVDNKLLLYTAKTGVPVYCPLPDAVVKMLEQFPHVSERFFFWNGRTRPLVAMVTWSKRLKEVFRRAGIPDGKSHRLRDTFAVELLLQGVPIDRVSVLLGHSSIRVTEKHYAPWVRARQEQLEADVQRAWAHDPVLLEVTQANGTIQ